MTLLNEELKQIAVAVAQGEVATNFSNKDLSDKIREKMVEELGSDKLDYRTFRSMDKEFFSFVEETITPIVNDRTAEVSVS